MQPYSVQCFIVLQYLFRYRSVFSLVLRWIDIVPNLSNQVVSTNQIKCHSKSGCYIFYICTFFVCFRCCLLLYWFLFLWLS